VSLQVLGFTYEHDTLSVFGDFDALRAIKAVGLIPSLVLDESEMLIDGAALFDPLDAAGPARERRG
jgi:glutathione S-transferase